MALSIDPQIGTVLQKMVEAIREALPSNKAGAALRHLKIW